MKLHDLYRLFNVLPGPTRESITAEYDSLLSASEFYRALPAWQLQDFKLSAVLANASKTFELWRYPGEGVQLNAPGSLQHVVIAMQRYAQGNFPETMASLQSPIQTCSVSIYGGING